jgi:hypothetical protein
MTMPTGSQVPAVMSSHGAGQATYRPTVPQDDTPPPPPRGERALGMLQPFLLLCLGLLLGVVNQSAREVSGMLRVPALIAALILVGQALIAFDTERRPPRREVVVIPETVTVQVESPGRATSRETTTRVVSSVRDNVAVAKDSRWILLAGIVLSIWLGMASLADPTAPPLLLSLALIAAFLLFADSWRNLRRRR